MPDKLSCASGSVTVLAPGALPQPQNSSLALIANADFSRLDAALVRAPVTEIIDTATVGHDYVLTLGGPENVRVILDADAGLSFGQYIPGAKVEVLGLLVPEVSGRFWFSSRAARWMQLYVPEDAPHPPRCFATT